MPTALFSENDNPGIFIDKDYDVYLHLLRLSFALSIIGIQIEIMFTIVRLEHVYNLVPQMC